jgi:predicted nucleic acid-binding protein
MTIYYADSSALVKKYVNENGSDWTLQALAAPAVVITAQLTLIEIASALNRRVRDGTVTAYDYARLVNDFRDDCRDRFQIVTFDQALVNLSWAVLERHALRAYDAIHLASALVMDRQLVEAGLTAPVFLAADDRLLKAAQAEGLAVDNPNLHS